MQARKLRYTINHKLKRRYHALFRSQREADVATRPPRLNIQLRICVFLSELTGQGSRFWQIAKVVCLIDVFNTDDTEGTNSNAKCHSMWSESTTPWPFIDSKWDVAQCDLRDLEEKQHENWRMRSESKNRHRWWDTACFTQTMERK